MTPEYEPERYWSDRLGENCNLRGTGHLDYNERYNAWLYRAKRRALRQALTGVRTTGPVLDVGSGVGWVVGQLLDLGLNVEGCDISSGAIEGLRRNYPDVTFFQFALGSQAIERADGYYALATMFDVAYHITDDELWIAGLAELARVLRPGGALIVSDGFGRVDRVPAAHVRFRSERTWRQAERVGLTLVDIRPYFRWLSRDHAARGFRHLPDGVRGGIEYALESVARRTPHMRYAVLRRAPTVA
ncbi:MAG: hypothetical protein QOI10_2579 [Solirubrobacterales bacterium]|jgi:SAM-dependent methyltransferase|nr:hypothetical protein [Solirubrobacterales bacterium]